MFTPENMHFKRLSCWADMSTNYTGVSLWWYVFRLYMFSYRAGGLGRILTTWANPKPFHIFVHLASDHGVNFWKCISFNLMFVSYFMHFHGMSSWADFQTLGTLKTRQGDVPCLYMGFNCCFCWVWIITGKAAPTPTWVFTHLRVNGRLYGINITRYVHWINECCTCLFTFETKYTSLRSISSCYGGNDICECSESSWWDNVSGKLDKQSLQFANALLQHARSQQRYG